jgi:predicted DNA-binding transcriptional regulator AlpA
VEANELTGGAVSAVAAPLLITAEEVAGMLDISTRTLWRLVSGKRIVALLKIGGSTQWRRAEIEAWVAAGCPVPGRGERGRP